MLTQTTSKPDLHIFVGGATHFLRWEIPELKKYFNLVEAPSENTILLSFGPDTLEQASTIPALSRFAVTFPGFSINPLRDLDIRRKHIELFKISRPFLLTQAPLNLLIKMYRT